MAGRDYYAVLGVAKGATAEDIRKAYRTLARKYHPDVNKEAGAAQKFAELQNAYDVLSDEKKRALYDQVGPGAFEAGGVGGTSPRRGGSAYVQDFSDDELGDFFESVFGARPEGFGGGGETFRRPGPGRRPKARAPEAPVTSEVWVPFETVVHGGVTRVRVQADGPASTVEVKVPQGVEDGSQLRMRGAAQGRDLILTIRTELHPLFRRGEGATVGKGLDLTIELPLTFAESALGGVVRVPTPSGPVELSVPAGSASGRKLRLRGKGLDDGRGNVGDLYAVLRVVPPTGTISDEERALLTKLSARDQPRAGPFWPQ